MKWEDMPRQRCSIARSAGVIGDKWTLLLLRDCFMGLRRFEQFQQKLGISRTIVADRLKLLTEEGVLERVAYQERPVRYEYHLTAKGQDLFPVMVAILHWGDRHVISPEGAPPRRWHANCGHEFSPLLTCSECGEALKAGEIASDTTEPQPL